MSETNGIFPREISIATPKDTCALTHVINEAFKGDGKNDWNNCYAIIQDRPRISDELITKHMAKEKSVFIKYTCDDGIIGGCVYFDDRGDNKCELWLVGVSPEKQNQGIGKKLMEACVKYAKDQGYTYMKLTTPTDRPDVVAWYEKCGFTNTGKTLMLDWLCYMPNHNGIDELLCEETILTMDL